LSQGLLHFIHAQREPVNGQKDGVRLVYRSEILANGSVHALHDYISDRAPLFYRPLEAIVADLKAGYFLTAVKTTLAKLPTAQSFQESHFGEIVAAIFAEEVMGLRRLYSKLSMLTAENANGYKMDLVMYDPSSDPLRFVFGEVKCSPKNAADGLPSKHDQSCFADLFASFNKYSVADHSFDLTAARDNLGNIPEGDRQRVRAALMPYSGTKTSYAGFVIIDASTYAVDEAQILRTRKNKKAFEVDLLCVETFPAVAQSVYTSLQGAK